MYIRKVTFSVARRSNNIAIILLLHVPFAYVIITNEITRERSVLFNVPEITREPEITPGYEKGTRKADKNCFVFQKIGMDSWRIF